MTSTNHHDPGRPAAAPAPGPATAPATGPASGPASGPAGRQATAPAARAAARPTGGQARTPRHAARVAILAPDGAVLLLRYDNPEVGVHWSMPGGGLEPGESPREGAAREVREETGWDDIEPGPLLCTWEHDFTRGTVPVRQYEHIYAGHGPRRSLTGDLTAAHAADGILAARWWTPAELATAGEAIWPPNLSDLLADLRAHGPRDPAPDLGYVPNAASPAR